jgi:hypothetical protein
VTKIDALSTECPTCGVPAGARCHHLHAIVVRFIDDESGRTFAGYTDGRLWNGFICPHFALDEVRRVLDVLVAWGDEPRYTVIDDRQVRVHGRSGIAEDHVLTAKLVATPDGDRWLFDCGGMWTFVEAAN